MESIKKSLGQVMAYLSTMMSAGDKICFRNSWVEDGKECDDSTINEIVVYNSEGCEISHFASYDGGKTFCN